MQTSQEANFIKLCEWLEMEGDMYSILELNEQMKTLADANTEVYIKHIKFFCE